MKNVAEEEHSNYLVTTLEISDGVNTHRTFHHWFRQWHVVVILFAMSPASLRLLERAGTASVLQGLLSTWQPNVVHTDITCRQQHPLETAPVLARSHMLTC